MNSTVRWIVLVPGASLAALLAGFIGGIIAAPRFFLSTVIAAIMNDAAYVGQRPLWSWIASDCVAAFTFAAAAGAIAPRAKRTVVVASGVLAATVYALIAMMSVAVLHDPLLYTLLRNLPPLAIAIATAAFYRP